MGFQLSPGVNVSEIDTTTIVPAFGTTTGALAGVFQWGPTGERVLIDNAINLEKRFGKPDNDTYLDFFTGFNFLSYGDSLLVSRAAVASARNAVSGAGSIASLAVTGQGSAYATPPAITFTGGAGTGAAATAVMEVSATIVGTAGTGYTAATVAFSGGGATVQATGTVVLSGDGVGSITLVTRGSGYTSAPTVTISGDGSGAAVTANLRVLSLTLTNQGTGYTSAPTVVFGSGAATGTATLVAGIAIANDIVYENSYASGQANVGVFAAKYLGERGNSLKVSMADSAVFTGWDYEEDFDYPPAVGEVHIIVIDEDGLFTGTAGTVLEKYAYASKYSDAKEADGTSKYYANVVNDVSQYLRWTDHPFGTTDWGVVTGSATASVLSDDYTKSLALGVSDNDSVTSSEIIDALDLFANGDEVDISLVLGSAHTQASDTTAIYQHIIDNIVEVRKDCVAFLSPLKSDVVNNIGDESTDAVTFKNTTINRSSSYYVMDSNWKLQYDKYNDLNRWVPCNGDVAGLCVRTDTERDPWYSPAGFNRGQLKNVIKVAWQPSKAHRDVLYKNGLNPIVSFPGQGTILYGDKTGLSRPSAFDRINVRRLFIVLEKSIAKASQFTLFEFNDEFTRVQFRNLVEPFLRDVQGRRGIYEFRVVCDSTNNTPEVIDRNEFIGDIYIKPARSINFIQLNFIAVKTGVAFEEIVGKF
jgi:hypothetical protein